MKPRYYRPEPVEYVGDKRRITGVEDAMTNREAARVGVELLPCPFCGREPRVSERPDSTFPFVCFIACNCGGYSACAHKMGSGDSPEAARAEARAAWNARAAARVGAEWLPISSAPRDGWILLFYPNVVVLGTRLGTRWVNCFNVYCEPTHWQPLPASPTLPDAVAGEQS